MKKNTVFLKAAGRAAGLPALLLALGLAASVSLALAGCDTGGGEEEEGGNNDPKTIVIEGIQNYTGNGYISVFSDLNNVINNQPVNAGIGYGAITDSKLSIELTVPQNNTGSSATKWTGNGSYYIYFIPQVNDNYSTTNGMIYTGNGTTPLKYNINDSEITLSFGTFKTHNVWKN